MCLRHERGFLNKETDEKESEKIETGEKVRTRKKESTTSMMKAGVRGAHTTTGEGEDDDQSEVIGMSEGGDSWDPGPWRGYDYKSARAPYYDDTAGRGYSAPKKSAKGGTSGTGTGTATGVVKSKKSIEDLVPATIKTEARSPVVIITDGTGSMGEFPEVIFKKLPLLDLGIEDYLEDAEISVAMVGDAGCDSYPLQVQGFTKGKGLVGAINKLKIEGGGGGNQEESYDLAALYYARNAEMPKATKPVLIWICDEGIYPQVDKDWASKYARTGIEAKMPSKAVFDELKQKYSVYVIRKHYGGGVDGDKMTGSNLRIQKQWEEYVGAERIAVLNEPGRVVDVIFGLLAYETNKQELFEKELEDRQLPDKDGAAKVATVRKSLLTVGKSVKKLPSGRSVMKAKT